MTQSIVLSNDFVYRVNVVIRNEPLTGKFSYTLWDAVTGKKNSVQTQFTTFEDAAKAAACAVKEAIVDSAAEAESHLIEQLTQLLPQQ
jgi:hypothetical protein